MNLVAVKQQPPAFTFYWVTNHYDVHLTGGCYFEGSLCFFSLSNDPWEGTLDEEENFTPNEPPMYSIYSMTAGEKLNLLTHRFLFRLLVGNNYSYDKKGNREKRDLRPQWMWKLYYNVIKKLLPNTPKPPILG